MSKKVNTKLQIYSEIILKPSATTKTQKLIMYTSVHFVIKIKSPLTFIKKLCETKIV